jgi:ribosome biogenesis protein SSF1/2
MASESDVEDAGESTVTLADKYIGRGNMKSEERAIRLAELGPRMKLSVTKIQEGLSEGEVLYHSFVQKSNKEVQDMKKKWNEARKEKERRRKEQEENVRQKKMQDQGDADEEEELGSDEEEEFEEMDEDEE